MKHKKILVLVLPSIVILLALAALVTYLTARVARNPDGTVGNTAGNLNNSGLFCEYDGRVYFSNAYDNGSLYSMTPDEQELTKLNGVNVCNILAGGKYLYYFCSGQGGGDGLGRVLAMRSFNRCGLDGRRATSYTRDVVVTGQLVNNYLYLLTSQDEGPQFYKIKIDKSDKTVLANYVINPACAENGAIYYNGTQNDHALYKLNTDSDTVQELWQSNIWYPVKSGDYIYYMDVENNYRLCRYSLSQNVTEVLTEDRIECFNVGEGYIYYQCGGDAPALKYMLTDGSNPTTLAEGNYTNINLTSRYVYFQAFGNASSLYHAPLGSATYDSFHAAIGAVLE